MDSFRVLLVDDEADFLQVLATRLRRRGLEVAGVSSGALALAHLAEHAVDVVVLDVRMPGEDGIETLKVIKARHPDVQVVVLTGFADGATAVRVMKLGAFDYMMKPAHLDELLTRLQDAYLHKTVDPDLD